MEGVSPVSGYSGGQLPVNPTGMQGVTGGDNVGGHKGVTPPGGEVGKIGLSASSLQINQSASSMLSLNGGVIANNELLGAVLLMLMAEYMKENDDEQKKGILGLMGMIMSQQQQSSSMVSIYSSSLSIESTSIQTSTVQAMNAYNGASASMQQAPQVDSGAGGMNITA